MLKTQGSVQSLFLDTEGTRLMIVLPLLKGDNYKPSLGMSNYIHFPEWHWQVSPRRNPWAPIGKHDMPG